jgi:hypothetical protein
VLLDLVFPLQGLEAILVDEELVVRCDLGTLSEGLRRIERDTANEDRGQ